MSFFNKQLLLLLGSMFLLPLSSHSQSGDRKGHVMTPPPASWKIPPAPVVSPEDAPKGFAVEKGFRIELVASEPMINDPVTIAFDGNGRIWVAEMKGYMPDIAGKKEADTYGRISILEDTNGDGAADKRTIFLEKVLLPRAVALIDADKTLLFADNENLYEVEIKTDDNGDISAGEPVLVEKGYAAGGNPEHKGNGLLHGLDNWIYNAASEARFRKIDGKWVKEKSERRGQWGVDQDDYGRLFTNTNSNFIVVEEIPPNVKVRNSNHRFASKVVSQMKNQKIWPSRINPGVNRGYMESTLDENGYLRGPTAVSGLAVYRGDQFPEEYYGNLFLPEPSGNMMKRATLTEGADGFREVESAYEGKEFFTSTDERSRIVHCFTAPDGTLYLIDLYRGILQHAVYMTSFLRTQIEERKLHEPVGLGRIWRIAHDGGKELGPTPRMQEESTVALVAHLAHPNGWWRTTSQRLIVERGADKSVTAALENLAANSEDHLARIHAIWTLEGLNQLSVSAIKGGLTSKHPRAVAEIIRASASLAGFDESSDVLKLLKTQISNKNVFVQRSLASTLGLYGEGAHEILVDLLEIDPNDSLLTDLVMSGISGSELSFYRKAPGKHPIRASLIGAVLTRNVPEEVTQLISAVESLDDYKSLGRELVAMRRNGYVINLLDKINHPDANTEIYKAVIAGMLSGGKGKKFKRMPLKEAHPVFKKSGGKNLAKLFTIGTGKEVVYLRTAADKAQFKLGETQYQKICLPCHQAHGKGQAFLAPPIVGSEWAMGPKKRLIALTMDGAQGPIEVLGKLYKAPDIQPLMPGLRLNPELDDEKFAAILTYVRNSWGNGATPVSAKEVKKYRESTKLRAPYSAEELLKIK